MWQEEAVSAYRAALEVFLREFLLFEWATTQTNLGNVLWNLGEREVGITRLEEAVLAFRAALEVFESCGATDHVCLANGNIAGVDALLAERRAGS